jgi:hypothetical protein
MTDQVNELTPVRVAFVIDNVVADVLHTDERLASIFLSNPLVVDISDFENKDKISVNSEYDPATGEFTDAPPPEVNTDIEVISVGEPE